VIYCYWHNFVSNLFNFRCRCNSKSHRQSNFLLQQRYQETHVAVRNMQGRPSPVQCMHNHPIHTPRPTIHQTLSSSEGPVIHNQLTPMECDVAVWLSEWKWLHFRQCLTLATISMTRACKLFVEWDVNLFHFIRFVVLGFPIALLLLEV